jgi:hypothetical protein
MSLGRENEDPQLARIELLLKAARLEVVGLGSTDHELRRAICGDLDDMLKMLRSSVQAVLVKHGLEPLETSSQHESDSQHMSSDRAQAPPHRGGRRPV